MARPTKAVVDYFPHNCKHGKTMFAVENRFGNDGYAFWFKLLELLGSTEHHFIDCNDIGTWEYLLALTRFSEDKANQILDLLSRLGSIDGDLWKMRVVRSEHFVENLTSVYKRREISVYTNAQVINYCIQKYPQYGDMVSINPQSKVEESKVKESRERAREVPPPVTDESFKKIHDAWTSCGYGIMSPATAEVMASYLEDMELPVILYAIEQGDLNAKRTLGYVKAILKRCLDEGIKTGTQLEATEKARTATKARDAPGTRFEYERKYTEEELEHNFVDFGGSYGSCS